MTAKRIKKAAILVCAGFMALSLPGVGSTALGAPSNRETRIQEETWGRVFLSAGPKISLSYDRRGPGGKRTESGRTKIIRGGREFCRCGL